MDRHFSTGYLYANRENSMNGKPGEHGQNSAIIGNGEQESADTGHWKDLF